MGTTTRINFHNVVEAEKAAVIFGWKRHHIYGRLEFEVTDDELKLLEKEKIGFWFES